MKASRVGANSHVRVAQTGLRWMGVMLPMLALSMVSACVGTSADATSSGAPDAAVEPDYTTDAVLEAGTPNQPGQVGSGDVEKAKLSGFAQKGPFLNGANLTLLELGTNLAPTGRTFQTNIVDDTGAFTFRDVALDNSVAVIRVDGFYLNEVLGKKSSSQITLSALTDLGVRDSANINLLSHLEKARVEYLIEEGANYTDAKQQALGEIFAAFGLQLEGTTVSEALDLTAPGANNAGLLAISSTVLGYRSDAAFSETLANIAGDMRTDGTLDSASLLSDLVNHARLIDPAEVRAHLEERYASLGQEVEVPDFGAALSTFVAAHTSVPRVTFFNYPEDSLLEVLFSSQDGAALSANRYVLGVDEAGAPLRLDITSMDGGIWYYTLGGSGFLVSDFDDVGCTQSFELTEFGTKARVDIEFGGGDYRIDVYEGSLTTPAWTRLFSTSGMDQGFGGICSGVLPERGQGQELGACYQDNSCNTGLTCTMGKACDAQGLAMCCLAEGQAGPGPGVGGDGGCDQNNPCESGLTCVHAGSCALDGCCLETGEPNQACNADGSCNEEGFTCELTDVCGPSGNCCLPEASGPVGSGSTSEPNPSQDECHSDGTCDPGFACVEGPVCGPMATNCCVPSGEAGQACNQDGSCGAAAACVQGSSCGELEQCCVAAGGIGQPCLTGGTCHEGFACANDPQCEPEIGDCCVANSGEPEPGSDDAGASAAADAGAP